MEKQGNRKINGKNWKKIQLKIEISRKKQEKLGGKNLKKMEKNCTKIGKGKNWGKIEKKLGKKFEKKLLKNPGNNCL